LYIQSTCAAIVISWQDTWIRELKKLKPMLLERHNRTLLRKRSRISSDLPWVVLDIKSPQTKSKLLKEIVGNLRTYCLALIYSKEVKMHFWCPNIQKIVCI
jgi:hypothetical protein